MKLTRSCFLKAMAVAVALLVASSSSVVADTLTTAAPNNGTGGVFLDLTAAGSPLSINSFDAPFAGSAGVATQVEVWTRPGSYVGFSGSNAGWTLQETAPGLSAGSSVFGPITLGTPISIGAGSTTGVYLHSITTGQGLRYTGTNSAPPQTTWSDANLTLFSDVARTGSVSFGGTAFSPRTFSGNVNYSVVPEPMSLAILGMMGVICGLRRR